MKGTAFVLYFFVAVATAAELRTLGGEAWRSFAGGIAWPAVLAANAGREIARFLNAGESSPTCMYGNAVEPCRAKE